MSDKNDNKIEHGNKKKKSQKQFEKISIVFKAVVTVLEKPHYSETDIQAIRSFWGVANDFLKTTSERRYAVSKTLLLKLGTWLDNVQRLGLYPISQKNVGDYFGEMAKLAEMKLRGTTIKMKNVLTRHITGFFMALNVEKTNMDQKDLKHNSKKIIKNISINSSKLALFELFKQKVADLLGERMWKENSHKMTWLPYGDNFFIMRGLHIPGESGKEWFRKRLAGKCEFDFFPVDKEKENWWLVLNVNSVIGPYLIEHIQEEFQFAEGSGQASLSSSSPSTSSFSSPPPISSLSASQLLGGPLSFLPPPVRLNSTPGSASISSSSSSVSSSSSSKKDNKYESSPHIDGSSPLSPKEQQKSLQPLADPITCFQDSIWGHKSDDEGSTLDYVLQCGSLS